MMINTLEIWYWALVLMLGANLGAIAYLVHIASRIMRKLERERRR